MYDINTAPRDGRFIILIRKYGDRHKGRWAAKLSFTHEFGWHEYPEKWLSEDEKFLDVPLNPVIGWDILKGKA